jgi:hypothetical protein
VIDDAVDVLLAGEEALGTRLSVGRLGERRRARGAARRARVALRRGLGWVRVWPAACGGVRRVVSAEVQRIEANDDGRLFAAARPK